MTISHAGFNGNVKAIPFDGEFPVGNISIKDFRHSPVIPNIEQFWRSKKAFVEQI